MHVFCRITKKERENGKCIRFGSWVFALKSRHFWPLVTILVNMKINVGIFVGTSDQSFEESFEKGFFKQGSQSFHTMSAYSTIKIK